MLATLDAPSAEVKVSLNVPRAEAEILYEDLEGLLNVLLNELILDNQRATPRSLLENSAVTLTTFLSNKVNQAALKVTNVEVFLDPNHLDQKYLVGVRATVPNFWAMNYGLEDVDLTSTVDYLRDQIEEKEEAPSLIAGAIYYHDHEMKMWDGREWKSSAR